MRSDHEHDSSASPRGVRAKDVPGRIEKQTAKARTCSVLPAGESVKNYLVAGGVKLEDHAAAREALIAAVPQVSTQ